MPSFAGSNLDADPDEIALVVQARLELVRIRIVRHEILTALLVSPDLKLARWPRNLERYRRAAYARQWRPRCGEKGEQGITAPGGAVLAQRSQLQWAGGQ
jgi:hypothetical protein